jgi:hypothetical protein
MDYDPQESCSNGNYIPSRDVYFLISSGKDQVPYSERGLKIKGMEFTP